MPAWRPSEMTDEKVKKLEEVFALDCTIEEACFYANISKTTYYNWLEAEPELVDRFEALRQNPVLTARTTVVNAIKEDAELAMKYLERKKKWEFSPKTEIDSNHSWTLNIGWLLSELQWQNTNN